MSNPSKKHPKSITDQTHSLHNQVRMASLQERFEGKRQAELLKQNPSPQQMNYDPIAISTPPPKTQNYYPILESLQQINDFTQFYSPQQPLLTAIPENPQNHLAYYGYPLYETYNMRENPNGYLNNNLSPMERNLGGNYQNYQTEQMRVNKENWDNRQFLTENKKAQVFLSNFRKNPSENFRKSSPVEEPKSKRVGDYEFLKEPQNIIGSGTFSKVYIGNHFVKKTLKVAIKVIDSYKCPKTLIDEIYITKSMNSPNVVHIYDYYLDQKKGKCYLVLELCNQGSLESHKPRPDIDLSHSSQLKVLYRYFQQILKGLRPLYDLNIMHRDLKLSNILLNDGVVKISDFGFAKHMGNFSQLNSVKCGTPSTMAPEIIFQENSHVNFNKKSDIWSLGIILHELVYGVHPFDLNANDMQKGKRVKMKRTYALAESFIERALKYDLKERMSWEEVFNHPINFIDDDEKFIGKLTEKSKGLKKEVEVGKIREEVRFMRTGVIRNNTRKQHIKNNEKIQGKLLVWLIVVLISLLIYRFLYY